MNIKSLLLAGVLLFAFSIQQSKACTNYLITKGASVDGSTMISYSADSHVLYGELYHWAAQKWPAGTMMDVYEWDTGKKLGQIPQAAETYNVVGNANEHQVSIGETTYGGRADLHHQDGAIMDYGSMIYIALQRSKTAREAIKLMTDLVAEYGYYSEGESFSIADKNEVWIMELIGKGQGEKGAVWVAVRIPDGYVSGHANQARITTFDYQKKNKWDKEDAMFFNSKDVISFAKKKEYFTGKDKDFSFSDTYAPVDFGGARFCEMRVYSMFHKINKEVKDSPAYWEYVKGNVQHGGENGYASNRMPLYVKPDHKVSVHDMMGFMRDHLEGTELDMSKDMGAGPFGLPYRWRGLTWKVDGKTYCNERATATQQAGFSFVSQMRSWLPDEIGGIIWWGVDDPSGTVYMPFYTSMTTAPENFKVGNGSMMDWSETSGFWIFNQVENFAYMMWNRVHPDIVIAQTKLEQGFIAEVQKTDAEAKSILESKGRDAAISYVSDYSHKAAAKTFTTWKSLYQQLFMKYMDGNIKTKEEVKEGYKMANPKVEQPGYGENFYRKIVEETGNQFEVK
ncbi:MAG: dipeptidase [Bacteroidetes bacterium 4572_112]|nr:MAG: dipeptidase [Bacteroidetes bacterium 4572_112]